MKTHMPDFGNLKKILDGTMPEQELAEMREWVAAAKEGKTPVLKLGLNEIKFVCFQICKKVKEQVNGEKQAAFFAKRHEYWAAQDMAKYKEVALEHDKWQSEFVLATSKSVYDEHQIIEEMAITAIDEHANDIELISYVTQLTQNMLSRWSDLPVPEYDKYLPAMKHFIEFSMQKLATLVEFSDEDEKLLKLMAEDDVFSHFGLNCIQLDLGMNQYQGQIMQDIGNEILEHEQLKAKVRKRLNSDSEITYAKDILTK